MKKRHLPKSRVSRLLGFPPPEARLARHRLPADAALPLEPPPPKPPPSPFVPEGETKNSCSQFVFPLQLSACAADQPTFKAMISSDPPRPHYPSHTHPLPPGGEGTEVVLGGSADFPSDKFSDRKKGSLRKGRDGAHYGQMGAAGGSVE